MTLTQELLDRIAASIKDKTGGVVSTCPMCGHDEWTLADGYAAIAVGAAPNSTAPYRGGGQVLPCAVVVCDTCGNTVFLNLYRLGLADLIPEIAEPNPVSPGSQEAATNV